MTLELSHLPGAGDGRPPLLFIHGSFSGAWIWQHQMMPWFAGQGWECLALSLRGHGQSEGADRLDHFGLHDYVEDVAQAAATLDRPPILVGHSLGGAVAQMFASRHASAGQILLASAPPGGLAVSAWHMLLHRPAFAWQMGMLEAVGAGHAKPDILLRNLFSPDMPPEDAWSFLPLMQRESSRAVAEIMFPLGVHRPASAYPTLVIGGDEDAFVTRHAMRATADFWKGELRILPGLPHVMMLDPHWEGCAREMADWLGRTFP